MSTSRKGRKSTFESLRDYCDRTKAKRVRVARHLGVSRFQFAGLQDPTLYPVPELTDELVGKIAELLNRPASYVRSYYERAA